MDFAIDGVHWWSLIILEGYSRTMLAGMIAPTEATWVALMVLYTACLRYGAPASLVSYSGGAYTSADFEAVCTRLQIRHETIVSTQGESYQKWMETHFNGFCRTFCSGSAGGAAAIPANGLAVSSLDGNSIICERLHHRLGSYVTRIESKTDRMLR